MTGDSMIIANCVINAVLSCTTIMLNTVTILALRKTSSELPKNLKTLLLSLSVSDLGVGLLAQPLYIAVYVMLLEQNTENYAAVRSTYYIMNNLLGVTSFLSVAVLSADRFLAIQLHFRYQELVTHKRVVAVVISIWMSAAFIALLRLLKNLTILPYIICIILIVCLISTALFYCKIYLVVRRHANHIQEMQEQQAAPNGAVMENAARYRKSAVALFYVYLVLLVCFLPNLCIIAVIIILGQGHIPLPIAICSDTLVFLHSFLNPLIYCWKIKHIRHAMKDVLRNISPSHD